jgi:hypothetical protein
MEKRKRGRPRTRSPVQGGVYAIWCIVTGECYVGMAADLDLRRRAHFLALERGDHPNELLAERYRQYGRSAFDFEIMAVCPDSVPRCWRKVWLLRQEGVIGRMLRPQFNSQPLNKNEHDWSLYAEEEGNVRWRKARASGKASRASRGRAGPARPINGSR